MANSDAVILKLCMSFWRYGIAQKNYDLFYYFEWSKKLLYDYQNKIIYKKIPDIIRDLRLTPPSQQYW